MGNNMIHCVTDPCVIKVISGQLSCGSSGEVVGFRFASVGDVVRLADLYRKCEPRALLSLCGRGWLCYYFRVILEEQKSIVLVGVDSQDVVLGGCFRNIR